MTVEMIGEKTILVSLCEGDMRRYLLLSRPRLSSVRCSALRSEVYLLRPERSLRSCWEAGARRRGVF